MLTANTIKAFANGLGNGRRQALPCYFGELFGEAISPLFLMFILMAFFLPFYHNFIYVYHCVNPA